MLHKGTLGDYHMAHNPFPFTRDSHPDLTKTIMGVVGTKPVSEAASPCEKAAAKRLRDANAEDLKEKPGAAGEAAHKRLHKTVKSVVGEGVIGDTVQRVKNKLRGDGFRTDRAVEAERSKKAEDSKKPARKKPTPKKKKGAKTVGKGGKLPDRFREWDRSQKEKLDRLFKGAGMTPALTDDDHPGYSRSDTERARQRQRQREDRARRESGY